MYWPLSFPLRSLNKKYIFRDPTQPQERICKRIVGLPGDRVPGHYKGPEMFVPAGQVWMAGLIDC